MIEEAASGTLARLRAREALLSEAEGIVGVGSYVWEPGATALWSDAFYRLLGYEPGSVEPSAQVFFAAVHPDDLARVRAGHESVAKLGVLPDIEYRIIRYDNGETRYIRGSGCVYRNLDGSMQRLIGALQDITESKRAALALEQALTVSRAVEELAQSGSFVVKLDPLEIVFSEGLQNLTGLRGTAIEAAEALKLVHAEDRAHLAGWWSRLMRDQRVEPNQSRLCLPDGRTRHVYTRATLTELSDGGRRVVGSSIDITERVELEGELQRAAKLEAVGTLAAGVAHDFNNYLMVVSSALEQLGRADAFARERLVGNAQRAVTRCAELTRQLLGFARCQPFRPELVDLCAVVENMQDLFQQSLGRRAELRIQAPPSRLFARLDSRQLEQMLVNLIVNAADAIEASHQAPGEVRIIADDLQLTAARPGIPDDVPPGRYARICVEDDGGGVAPEVLPRIFEPYFTTKPRGRGTGLGLSAVYGMAHQNGGAVTVEALAGGTRFSLWFAMPELPARRVVRDQAPRHWRVLVVDDMPQLAGVASALLRDAGFETLQAEGGSDALAKLAAHTIDVVLSDIQMPGMDGYALAEEIRARFPGLPVVLMTGHACARSHGDPRPTSVLQKPFTGAELVAFVRGALT